MALNLNTPLVPGCKQVPIFEWFRLTAAPDGTLNVVGNFRVELQDGNGATLSTQEDIGFAFTQVQMAAQPGAAATLAFIQNLCRLGLQQTRPLLVS